MEQPKQRVPKFACLYREINRLRSRDGEEPVGGLMFAQKVFDHFHVENNPRVAEALKNLQAGCICQKQPCASGPQ